MRTQAQKEQRKISYQKNRLRENLKHKEWAAKNRQKIREAQKKSYWLNRDKYNTKNKESYAKRIVRLRGQILNHYGSMCKCCHEMNEKFLTIDHINGTGKSHRERTGGAVNFYSSIIKSGFPNDLQILCWNCNCGRALNGGICPHSSMPVVPRPAGSTI